MDLCVEQTSLCNDPYYKHLSLHEPSLLRDAEDNTTIQQKGKATQHNSPDTIIFQRKIGCLGHVQVAS